MDSINEFLTFVSEEDNLTNNALLTYDQIKSYSNEHLDLGMNILKKNDKIYHVLNQEITVTLQQYKNDNSMKASIITARSPFIISYVDKEVPYHYNDFIQITYLLMGSLTIQIDSTYYTFHENEIYLIDKNTYHREVFNNTDAVVINICLDSALFDEILLSNIKLDSLQGFIRNSLINAKNLYKFLHFSPHNTEYQKLISHYINEIFTESKHKNPGYIYVVKGYLVRLMDSLANNYSYSFDEDDQEKYKKFLFQEIENYMITHLQDVQLNNLTNQFHYQNNYISNLIKTHTGMSFVNFLGSLRIRKAKFLLQATTLSIEDIMALVGYHNKGFFYKLFKEQTGVTPGKYRRNLKMDN